MFPKKVGWFEERKSVATMKKKEREREKKHGIVHNDDVKDTRKIRNLAYLLNDRPLSRRAKVSTFNRVERDLLST